MLALGLRTNPWPLGLSFSKRTPLATRHIPAPDNRLLLPIRVRAICGK